MRHLFAVSNPETARHLIAMVGQLGSPHQAQVVLSLSEAYHLSEHNPPDYLFIGPRMALDPLFDGLHQLVHALPTQCAVLLPTGPTRLDVKRLAQNQDLPTIDIHLGPYVFLCSLSELDNRGEGQASQQRPGMLQVQDRLILIGASTGGVDALQQVLASFRDDCPPTLIVQHTSRGFGEGLARVLGSACRALVQPAIDGVTIQPGNVYLATDPERHLTLDSGGARKCRFVAGDKVSGHRPSIDMLFGSAVPVASKVSAALLTGMGSDGAKGLLQLRDGGATTLGQDATSSVVYGMPRVAFELGAVQRQLPPIEIGKALCAATAGNRKTEWRATLT